MHPWSILENKTVGEIVVDANPWPHILVDQEDLRRVHLAEGLAEGPLREEVSLARLKSGRWRILPLRDEDVGKQQALLYVALFVPEQGLKWTGTGRARDACRFQGKVIRSSTSCPLCKIDIPSDTYTHPMAGDVPGWSAFPPTIQVVAQGNLVLGPANSIAQIPMEVRLLVLEKGSGFRVSYGAQPESEVRFVAVPRKDDMFVFWTGEKLLTGNQKTVDPRLESTEGAEYL